MLSLLQSYPGSRWGNCETRGLDTDFAIGTYVETKLEETLYRDVRERRVRLVILCGNAGDGKTALLQHLAARLGLGRHTSSERVLQGKMSDGPTVRMNLDGSAAWQDALPIRFSTRFLEPFTRGGPAREHRPLAGDKRWPSVGVDRGCGRLGGEANGTSLTKELYGLLQQETFSASRYIRFISLNQRSIVGGIADDKQQIETAFLERLLDRLYGGEKRPRSGALASLVRLKNAVKFSRSANFGPEGLPGWRKRRFARVPGNGCGNRCKQSTCVVKRTSRSASCVRPWSIFSLASIFVKTTTVNRIFPRFPTGTVRFPRIRLDDKVKCCASWPASTQLSKPIPRLTVTYLVSPCQTAPRRAPHYEHLCLESARCRAYFEWTEEDIVQVAGEPHALDLARGRHLRLFRNLPLEGDPQERVNPCSRLCAGISRLEALPPQALDRPGVVPLRVTPRTPTETAFSVEKPLNAFRLEADLAGKADGSGTPAPARVPGLPYRDGKEGEERLRLAAELFHLLLELSEGYQLGDISTDDTFAHLSIFVQRLVREDECDLLAWNPMRDEMIYRVSAKLEQTSEGPQQRMILSPLPRGGQV